MLMFFLIVFANKSSAGGQLLQPCEVNNSTKIKSLVSIIFFVFVFKLIVKERKIKKRIGIGIRNKRDFFMVFLFEKVQQSIVEMLLPVMYEEREEVVFI
jgi:hypothetical protein